MRVRVAILIVLAVLLAAVAMLALWQAVVLSNEANHLFNGTTSTPSVADQSRASELWSQSSALQQLVTPLATAALLCVTAVLAILAWGWQRRVGRPEH
jgi:hypothetical protein